MPPNGRYGSSVATFGVVVVFGFSSSASPLSAFPLEVEESKYAFDNLLWPDAVSVSEDTSTETEIDCAHPDGGEGTLEETVQLDETARSGGAEQADVDDETSGADERAWRDVRRTGRACGFWTRVSIRLGAS